MRLMGSEVEHSVTRVEPLFPGELVPLWALKDIIAQDNLPDGLLKSRKFLSNGSGLYIDNGEHVEYCTPEVPSALEATLCERAGALIVAGAVSSARESRREDRDYQFRVFRRLTDGISSWGYHLNAQANRSLEVNQRGLAPLLLHMVGGISLFGSGFQEPYSGGFRISQKSHDIHEYVNEHTMKDRPLINTRDEPHADPAKWRRLHITGGDVLHSPWATWLRYGTTDLCLSLCEARPDIAEKMVNDLPVDARRSMYRLGKDTAGDVSVLLRNGQQATMGDMQWMIYGEVAKAAEAGDIKIADGTEEKLAFEEWGRALADQESSPESLTTLVDWRLRKYLGDRDVAKYGLTDASDIRSRDITMDDIESLPNTVAERFQGILRRSGLERLGEVFGVTSGSLENRIQERILTPPPGRPRIRAEYVRIPGCYVDWAYAQRDFRLYEFLEDGARIASTKRVNSLAGVVE